MTQLSYNEAFDPYHAIFRYFRLYFGCGLREPVPFDKFRILDFYLLYPFRLQNLQFFSDDTTWRSVSKGYARLRPYGELPDDHSLFDRMAPFQKTAAESMARAGVIHNEAWEKNQVSFAGEKLGTEIESRCAELNASMADFISILCQINRRYDLYGRDGLKARSKLLEYRYDPI
ncbi:hypothetical protein GR197_29060 [Rhizobium phaseoli]|uniref:Uncharacterized protein n=1 Tax=Rhizobium phaseoli TaxID=396 RepID=A0A7K3ULH2_9HYPH|nr:ABC-three component system middle component 5 [Rhizobium phaseoli]NEJ74530.1 hypothetical protein [Rhizobium phaseoli]